MLVGLLLRFIFQASSPVAGDHDGQLLAGIDPIEAAKYQILLLFLRTGAGGLASTGAVWLAARAITDDRQRLRMDLLVGTTPSGTRGHGS